MYDYKALRKIIILLAILFGMVMIVLVVTSLPLNKFAWLSVLLLVVVAIYFTSVPLRLIKEMEDMEQRLELYKRKASEVEKSGKTDNID